MWTWAFRRKTPSVSFLVKNIQERKIRTDSLGTCSVTTTWDENTFIPLLQLHCSRSYQRKISFCPSPNSIRCYKSPRREPNKAGGVVNRLLPALTQFTASLCARTEQPVRTDRSFYKFSYNLKSGGTSLPLKRFITIKISIYIRI